jgi:hypothetical protein
VTLDSRVSIGSSATPLPPTTPSEAQRDPMIVGAGFGAQDAKASRLEVPSGCGSPPDAAPVSPRDPAWTPERRQVMSASTAASWARMSPKEKARKLEPGLAALHSPEAIKKSAAARRGRTRTLTPEQRVKLAAAGRRGWTPERRIKQAEKMRAESLARWAKWPDTGGPPKPNGKGQP